MGSAEYTCLRKVHVCGAGCFEYGRRLLRGMVLKVLVRLVSAVSRESSHCLVVVVLKKFRE